MNNPTDCTSSKDAYMLIYARRDKETGPVAAPQCLARQRVAELNRRHEDACNAYLKK